MEADESGTIARQKAHRTELIDPKITEHNGRIVKTTGDGILVEFASVVDAVKCAVAIQTAMVTRESDVSLDRRIQYRFGINIGDIIVDGEDIFGDGVNVAARIEGLCQPGEVFLSGTAYDHVNGKIPLLFKNLGEQIVKNISKPIRVFRVELDASVKDKPKSPDLIDAQSLSEKPSIAVLPFDNLSNDPEQEYFSDGITEDIITALSRIRQFFIIARNTTFTYKGQNVDVQAIAKDLGVQYVLEGSVRKVGNRVRITAQLIDGLTGNHLWAEKYDRDLEDIFEVQDEITLAVVGAIEPELAEAEREKAKSKSIKNLAAWDFYQRGWSFLLDAVVPFKQGKMTNTEEAKAMFEKAIELDSDLSAAYSGLAICYFYSLLFGNSDNPKQHVEEGLSIARRAVELDSEDTFARIAMGTMHWIKREADYAIAQLETAIELNPSSAIAYFNCGRTLASDGRAKDAISDLEKALRLSPRDPHIGATMVGMEEVYLKLGNYEKAAEWAEKALRQPGTGMWGSTALIAALGHLGRDEDAKNAIDQLFKRKPDSSISFVEANLPITDTDFMADYIDGLSKAGLPRG